MPSILVGAIGLLMEFDSKNAELEEFARKVQSGAVPAGELVETTDRIREWNADFVLRVKKEIQRHAADGCCVEDPQKPHYCINCAGYIE